VTVSENDVVRKVGKGLKRWPTGKKSGGSIGRLSIIPAWEAINQDDGGVFFQKRKEIYLEKNRWGRTPRPQ